MERIYQVIQKHRLTFEELMSCFDATYKNEKAAEYKALYKKYQAFDPEFAMPKMQGVSNYFYECSFIENCLFHLFQDKDVTIKKIVGRAEGKNSIPNTPENVFFYFLIKQLTIEPKSLNYPQPLFRFLPKKFRAVIGTNVVSDAETAKSLFRVIRANDNCSNDSLPTFERKVYGDDLRKSIAVYLEFYKDKKITATIEALKAHELHCQLLSKFIEYPWENLDKIEDDFKYLISFIYALKLHIFVISEGERLRLRKENNKIFPSIFMGNHIYDGALKEFKAKVEYMNVLQQITSHPKQAHLGLYNDFETIEELVVRCADYFFKNEMLAMVSTKSITVPAPKSSSHSEEDSAEYHSVEEWESFELEQDENKE